jgi:hypothetical protein
MLVQMSGASFRIELEQEGVQRQFRGLRGRSRKRGKGNKEEIDICQFVGKNSFGQQVFIFKSAFITPSLVIVSVSILSLGSKKPFKIFIDKFFYL